VIDVREHAYDDDPRRGHPDVRTILKDGQYFLLGNGLIQAAVQLSPAGEGTPVGLLIMNPEVLGKKRDALTMDPETGLEQTMLRIDEGRKASMPKPGGVRAFWTEWEGRPAVRAEWEGADFGVVETFFCPEDEAPILQRRVAVVNKRHSPRDLRLLLGLGGGLLEHRLPTPAGGEAAASLRYRLSGQESGLAAEWTEEEFRPEKEAAGRRPKSAASAVFGHALVDHFFRAAAAQLPACVSRSGRMDGSVWQYNREWVRDQSMVAQALAMLGEKETARTMLERLLREFVAEDGGAADSSERRAAEDAELDQNGLLLWSLETFFNWTGDIKLIEENWGKVSAAAEYPLSDGFRHQGSGLLVNRREYWERHGAHGIEPGLELAHQFFVSIGLSSAARLARILGRPEEADRWASESRRLRKAMLEDPRFGLVDGGRFIKRRGLDGSVQESITAREDSGLPDESPLARPGAHFLNPDTCAALPIALEFIPARSELTAATLEDLEGLWNQTWSGGGYGRYHVTSEPDSAGPWPFPSLFVARAHAETGEFEKVWRVLKWLESLPSGRTSAAWFEFYGERLAPPFPQVGIVPWTWAEIVFLLVRHVLGVRPEIDRLRLKPRVLSGLERLKSRLPLRNGFLNLEIAAGRQGVMADVRSSTEILDRSGEEVSVAYPDQGDFEVRIAFS